MGSQISMRLVPATAVLLSAGCATTRPPRVEAVAPAAEVSPLAQDEEARLDVIVRVADASRRAGEDIWPGFEPHAEPLLLFFPDGRGLLVNEQMPAVAAAQPTAREGVHRVRDRSWLPSPDHVFKKAHRAGPFTVFAILCVPARQRGTWADLLVHEMFHQWQEANWTPAPRPAVCAYPLADTAHLALLRVEHERLAAALVAPPGPERTRLTREFVALRLSRKSSGTGLAAAAIEDHEERLEGMARFVELRYRVETGEYAPGDVEREVLERLSSLKIDDLQKWRHYWTGAAVALLLDREGRRGFRAEVARGGNLDAALREASGLDDAALRSLASEVLARSDVKALSASFAADLGRFEEGRGRALDEYRDSGTREVTIMSDAPSSGYYSAAGPTYMLDDCFLLVSGLRTYADQVWGLHMSRRPVMLRSEGLADGPVTLKLRDDGNEPPVLDGSPLPDRGASRSFSKSLGIKGTGWSMAYRGVGRVDVAASGDVSIRLGQ